MEKYKIYVGHGLTNAPAEFLSEMKTLIGLLEAEEYEVLHYAWKDGGPSPGINVYKHDMSCIETCDLFLAIVTFPAIGLGAEFERALSLGRLILPCAHKGTKVIKFVHDALEYYGLQKVFQYERLEEITREVKIMRFGRHLSPKTLKFARGMQS